MLKFLSLLLVVLAISSATGQTFLVRAKQTELLVRIDFITSNAQVQLSRNQNIENAKVAALKLRIALAGKSTASCKSVEDALEVERKKEVKGVKDISDAKKAVLKTTVTIPTLNDFQSTLPGFKTELDDLIASYKPVYILAAGEVTTCYNGVLAAPK